MTDTVQARLRAGLLTGLREGGVCRYSAIPYAAPPLGPLRFAPPQPAAPWQGRRDATRPGPVAPQLPS
ncbi:carboxylesterase family protein, partial [Xylella fastidiosa subsp. multiplex]|nr:carboxylesterase family protein [Xylella fastidiosa subsp. multiplex]